MSDRQTAEEQSKRTRLLIILGVVLYSVYDVFARAFFGSVATLSTAIGEWMVAPWYGWSVCAIVGGLAGHFAGMMPADSGFPFTRLVVVVLSFVILCALTARS